MCGSEKPPPWQVHDIDWREGIAHVRGKTGERSAPFGRKTKLALRRYIDRERIAPSQTSTHLILDEHRPGHRREARDAAPDSHREGREGAGELGRAAHLSAPLLWSSFELVVTRFRYSRFSDIARSR